MYSPPPPNPIDFSAPEHSPFRSTNAVSRIMGLSFLGTLVNGLLYGQSALYPGAGAGQQGGPSPYLLDTLKLFLLGWIFESGRRLFSWIRGVFKPFQWSITAEFGSADPAYDWIVLLLTEEKIWSRSRRFRVHAVSSHRRWSVELKSEKQRQDKSSEDHAEYVPQYEEAQLFTWKGHLVHVSQSNTPDSFHPHHRHQPAAIRSGGRLYLTLYTRDMTALSALVEEARERYLKSSQPYVIVHTADQMAFNQGDTLWSLVKRKARRPLSSLILQEGIVNSLVEDVREFFRAEEWYSKAGIPHHRGYLLYGPPGTGKTSTIYAIAGELGLEIYSISLASSFVDDAFLARTLASIPKQAIFLLEDIDCAFASRDDFEVEKTPQYPSPWFGGSVVQTRGQLTLSGLLNALDGVGSEEGKIFFATTNYIDRLDPALLRPGRIDRKIEYKPATAAQAAALFLRFYPPSFITLRSEKSSNDEDAKQLSLLEKEAIITTLSEQFAAAIPEQEFTIAELQGFLLLCRQEPERAVEEVAKWVQDEKEEKAVKAKREADKKFSVHGGRTEASLKPLLSTGNKNPKGPQKASVAVEHDADEKDSTAEDGEIATSGVCPSLLTTTSAHFVSSEADASQRK